MKLLKLLLTLFITSGLIFFSCNDNEPDKQNNTDEETYEELQKKVAQLLEETDNKIVCSEKAGKEYLIPSDWFFRTFHYDSNNRIIKNNTGSYSTMNQGVSYYFVLYQYDDNNNNTAEYACNSSTNKLISKMTKQYNEHNDITEIELIRYNADGSYNKKETHSFDYQYNGSGRILRIDYSLISFLYDANMTINDLDKYRELNYNESGKLENAYQYSFSDDDSKYLIEGIYIYDENERLVKYLIKPESIDSFGDYEIYQYDSDGRLIFYEQVWNKITATYEYSGNKLCKIDWDWDNVELYYGIDDYILDYDCNCEGGTIELKQNFSTLFGFHNDIYHW